MVVDGFLKYDLLRIKKHIWNILLESFIYKGSWPSLDKFSKEIFSEE